MLYGESAGNTRGIALVICDVVFCVLAAVFYALRIYSIRLRGRKVFAHDVLISGALLASIGLAANQAVGVYLGAVGLHINEIEDVQAEQIALKTIVVATYLWPTATWFIKTSIMLMYIEIFETKLFRVMVWILVGVTSAFCLGLIIGQSVLCRPFAKNWNHALPGTCGDSVKTQWATAIFNLVLDLAIAALPLPILWKLQMNFRKKVVVTSLLSLGLVICAINLARLIVTFVVDWLDFTYSLALPAIFAVLEVTLGIVVACVPTLQPIFSRQARLGTTKASSNGYSKSMSNGSGFREDKVNRLRPHQDNSNSSPARLPLRSHQQTEDFDRRGFSHLDDEEFQLDDIRKGRNKVEVENRAESPGERGTSQDGVIEVRKELHVYGSERGESPKPPPPPRK